MYLDYELNVTISKWIEICTYWSCYIALEAIKIPATTQSKLKIQPD